MFFENNTKTGSQYTFRCKNRSTSSAVVKVSKPVVPLLKSEFAGEQFSASYIVKPAKSGGAMAPLAPLLTTSLTVLAHGLIIGWCSYPDFFKIIRHLKFQKIIVISFTADFIWLA